jgi:hypothetical protein
MLVLLMGYGCARETVKPDFRGNIQGKVQDNKTGKGIPSVSITTNPGTNAVLTDEKGEFTLTNVVTGKYTITAEKHGYETAAVNVIVEKNKTATAQILLGIEDNKPAKAFIKAQVTQFFNHSSHDSSFVDINYRVENISDHESVPNFEVYFKIYSPKTVFYGEIKGDSLRSGEQNVGSFTKYLHKASADSVAVSGIYAP